MFNKHVDVYYVQIHTCRYQVTRKKENDLRISMYVYLTVFLTKGDILKNDLVHRVETVWLHTLNKDSL